MAEGVEPDDRLVRLHVHAGKVLHHARGRYQVLRVDAGACTDEVLPRADRHHDLLERGVARALAEPVDRAFHLTRAGAHRGHAVGRAEAEVVVAVHGERDLVRALHVLQDAADELLELVRDRVADGVGDVDRRRAGLDHLSQHAVDEFGVGAGGVHRAELHVVAVALGLGHHLPRLLQDGLLVLAQLMRDVDVAAAEEDVQPRLLRVAHRLPALVHVVRHGAAEGGDLGAAHLLGDAVDRVEIGRAGRREAGLDRVDAHALEHLRDLQLLVGREGDTGGLFAVAQRGIEDLDSVSHWDVLSLSGALGRVASRQSGCGGALPLEDAAG